MLEMINRHLFSTHLLHVSQPTMVARYNRALEALCGKTVNLTELHIDASGYSPEVAQILGEDYLDQGGTNKRFIILSVDQIHLQLMDPSFTSNGDVIKSFIKDNIDALTTLTAMDAVYGELVNNLYVVTDVDDILNLRKVSVDIDTPKKLLTKGEKLLKMSQSTVQDNDHWQSDDYLNEMTELAKELGDVRVNAMMPTHTDYELRNLFTSHFGGLYVFRETPKTGILGKPAVIHLDEVPATDIPVNWIDGHDPSAVFKFLQTEGFISKLADNQMSARLEQFELKQRHILMEHLSLSSDLKFDEVSDYDLRSAILENHDSLPEHFHQLNDMIHSVANGFYDDAQEIGPYNYKISSGKKARAHKALVNHLVVRYTPMSLLRKFVFNYDLFKQEFTSWPKEHREYVVKYITDCSAYITEMRS
ncbi:DUF6638 family protein [Neptuniibacter sp. QD37_11]|uniref:DUF6638 family protein n=1 Tax=Neptuniibacter sp. QD37_11 TaxID=3398209 RepID=UPI0039F50E23